MQLPIITLPNPHLRETAKKVSQEKIKEEAFQKFITDMIETMKVADGIGLAATQVDRLEKLFVVDMEDGARVFINPQIMYRSWRKELDEEGCLSVPEVYGTVKRPKNVIVKAIDRNGRAFTIKAKGLLARVIQHENDHLDGVIFIDKVEKITKGAEALKNILK